jgi:threonine/homoserine/homoserine lactone efflux protein
VTNIDLVEGEHQLSVSNSRTGCMMRQPHLEAMLVVLTNPKKYVVWLNIPTEEALTL